MIVDFDAPNCEEINEDAQALKKVERDYNKIKCSISQIVYSALDYGLTVEDIFAIATDSIKAFSNKYPGNYTVKQFEETQRWPNLFQCKEFKNIRHLNACDLDNLEKQLSTYLESPGDPEENDSFPPVVYWCVGMRSTNDLIEEIGECYQKSNNV